MKSETMRTWVEIDTSALLHNLNIAKSTGKKVMCVIKANAYGQGAVQYAKLFEANGADAFAVACLAEAIELRENGLKLPILILGWTDASCAEQLSDYGLTQSIIDEDYAGELSRVAQAAGKVVDVHVKLDTGMSRTGLYAQAEHEKAAQAVVRIAALPGLAVKGIFTHYATADMPERLDFTTWQLGNYNAVMAELEKLGFDLPLIHHTSNSAAIMCHPDAHFDMVRMGVMMHGLYPDNVRQEDGPLANVITLKSRVAQVKEYPVGACVSYGCTETTQRPTKLAVVAIGYADGYPRRLSNQGTYAVINGQKCPLFGRICMDMCMFDVTDADVSRGDEVILFGTGGMSIEEVASKIGTINYEVVSLITKRVPKVYK